MSSGRREQKTDEKTFVADIARSFHVEKAASKAAKVERKNNTGARQASAEGGKKKGKKASVGGGSVWITFKGGFSGVPTDSAEQKAAARATADADALAAYRGNLTQAKFVEAAATAVGYINSAKEQAAEAGLHYTGESAAHCKKASTVQAAVAEGGEVPAIDYTEGDAYLREQKAIAIRQLARLAKAPIGTYMATLMGSGAATAPRDLPPAFADKAARDAFEDAVITHRQLVGDANVEAEALRAAMYVGLKQHADSQVAEAPSSKGNSLCIVRCKASASGPSSTAEGIQKKAKRSRADRGKKATITFRTKAKAETFVTSFMNNVIRKEMSSAMRIRDGAAGMDASASGTVVQPSAQQATNKGNGKKGRR